MMKDNKKRILWVTRTAIFLALLIVIQIATAPIKVTLLTGSLVNLLLIVSVMTCGLSSALVVAVISPVIAMLIGIGPMWVLIPFVAAGNAVLVLIWHFIGVRVFKEKLVGSLVSLIAGAAVKFAFLYFTIVRMMLPLFLNLPEKKAGAISAAFSFSQLFTALVGGAFAIAVVPIVKKAMGTKNS
jgi:hypothetical protein